MQNITSFKGFKSCINIFLVTVFVFLTSCPLINNLSASNFSESKAEMLAILEDPQLETLLGDQSILGVWKQNNSYWAWGSRYRYEVKLTYSPEGQIALEFLPGIMILN